MSADREQILSPLTGRKKRKAWNNTREKYKPKERRLKQKFHLQSRGMGGRILMIKVHFIMIVKVIMVIMMMRIIMKIWKQSFADVLQSRYS